MWQSETEVTKELTLRGGGITLNYLGAQCDHDVPYPGRRQEVRVKVCS
jgi:hypothetical protein